MSLHVQELAQLTSDAFAMAFGERDGVAIRELLLSFSNVGWKVFSLLQAGFITVRGGGDSEQEEPGGERLRRSRGFERI